MIKKILHHQLFSGSAIMFLGSMVANVINYLYHVVMGRLLGPSDYGVLASLYSIIYLISIIPSSASVSIVKFISVAKEDNLYSTYYTIKGFIFKLSMVLSFLMLLLSPFISRFLQINNVGLILLIVPILFFSLLTLVNQSSAQGLLKFLGSVVPTLISSFLKFAIGVLFILFGWSLYGAMASVSVGLVLAFVYSERYISLYIKTSPVKKVNLNKFYKYSGPVVIQSLALTSIITTDVLLAKHFLPDPFSAGIYAALSTLGKIIFFATSPIASTMFPIIAKRKSEGKKYINIFYAAFLATLLLSLIICIIYWLFSEISIKVLFGNAYLSAKKDLLLMGIFMTFYTLTNLLISFCLSLGKVKIIFAPIFSSIIQLILISIYHQTITQIIFVSLVSTFIMFVFLSVYTGYNHIYASKK